MSLLIRNSFWKDGLNGIFLFNRHDFKVLNCAVEELGKRHTMSHCKTRWYWTVLACLHYGFTISLA
jgi:hypothetical protein